MRQCLFISLLCVCLASCDDVDYSSDGSKDAASSGGNAAADLAAEKQKLKDQIEVLQARQGSIRRKIDQVKEDIKRAQTGEDIDSASRNLLKSVEDSQRILDLENEIGTIQRKINDIEIELSLLEKKQETLE